MVLVSHLYLPIWGKSIRALHAELPQPTERYPQ